MSRIAVTGAAGRMGRQLIAAIAERDETELVAAIEHPQSPAVGTDSGLLAGPEGNSIAVVAELEQAAEFDTIIDFSSPANTLAVLEFAAQNQAAVVVGTTGLTAEQQVQLERCAQRTAVVYAANYSVGVNLSLQLLAMAAQALGDRYDIEVIESHHRHKVDAPSGTALMMGQALAKAKNRDLDDCAVYAREGITGARVDGSIGFSAVRAGDIVGEHTVLFCGEGERLEITHRASDRMTFARGAVRAAAWLADNRPAGLYDMNDVLRAS